MHDQAHIHTHARVRAPTCTRVEVDQWQTIFTVNFRKMSEVMELRDKHLPSQLWSTFSAWDLSAEENNTTSRQIPLCSARYAPAAFLMISIAEFTVSN